MSTELLLRSGEDLRLVLTGAFFTGIAVVPEDDGHEAVQAELLRRLDGATGTWTATARGLDDAVLQRYAMDGSGSLTVPLFLVLCHGPDLLGAVRQALATDPDTARLRAPDRAFDWGCTDVQVAVSEAGIGTLRVTFRLRARRDLTAAEARADLEGSAEHLAQPLDRVSREVATGFATAAEQLTTVPGTPPWWYLGTGDAAHRREARGRLLWLHRVVVLDTSPEQQATLADRAEQLLPSTFARHRYGEVVFLPGISTSVVVRQPGDPALQQVLDLVDLEYAHYALTAELDRALFVRLRRLQDEAGESPRSLDQQADGIAALLDRVAVHRADIDTMLVDFGGGTIELWEVIAAVARQDHLDGAVDRKLAALSSAYRVRIDQAVARRQRRLDGIAFLFASLTLATSVIAAADFAFGGPVDDPARVRLVVLIGSFLVLVLLLLLYPRLVRTGRRRG